MCTNLNYPIVATNAHSFEHRLGSGQPNNMEKAKFIIIVILLTIVGGLSGWHFSSQELAIDFSVIIANAVKLTLGITGAGVLNTKNKPSSDPERLIRKMPLNFVIAIFANLAWQLWAIFSQEVGTILGMLVGAAVGICSGLYNLSKKQVASE